MKKDTFCTLPWVHLTTSPTGNLRVCCNSTPGKNVITDENGNGYKIPNFDKAWNSTYMKNLRLQMLNGEEPEICQKCFREEKAGIKSPRIHSQRWYDDNLIENTNPDGSTTPKIKYIDLRLGNLCNLRCRMCNPYSSNQWIDEWKKIYDNFSEADEKRLANLNWFEDEKVWSKLIEHLDNVEEVYITGGEPTLIKKQYQFLEHCIQTNVAENISLKYNTNATGIPSKLLDYWPYFKNVRIACSIDGYGKTNDYIRYPSKWENIDRNLKRLNTLASKHKNFSLDIHCTVQMYNILNLPELLNYVFYELDNFPNLPYLNVLNHPKCFNIKVLPTKLKKKATDRLIEWQTKNYDTLGDDNNFKKIDGLFSYIQEDWSEHMTEFVRQTTILDSIRNQNLLDIVPEFEEYLK